jgi:hypothetical protein
MSFRRLEVVPLVVTALAIIAVSILIVREQSVTNRIGNEVFALTYEFFLTVVIGSGVSVLFQTISYARELRDRRRALQREIHQALVTGYNDAKKARRLLRARARNAPRAPDGVGCGIDAAEYDVQMEALSTAQLSIELATRRIEVNRALFYRAPELLVAMNDVGKYLNTVIDEWEDVRPLLHETHAPLTMARVPCLDAFLRDYRESALFRDGFKLPFDDALRLIEEALLARA